MTLSLRMVSIIVVNHKEESTNLNHFKGTIHHNFCIIKTKKIFFWLFTIFKTIYLHINKCRLNNITGTTGIDDEKKDHSAKFYNIYLFYFCQIRIRNNHLGSSKMFRILPDPYTQQYFLISMMLKIVFRCEVLEKICVEST